MKKWIIIFTERTNERTNEWMGAWMNGWINQSINQLETFLSMVNLSLESYGFAEVVSALPRSSDYWKFRRDRAEIDLKINKQHQNVQIPDSSLCLSSSCSLLMRSFTCWISLSALSRACSCSCLSSSRYFFCCSTTRLCSSTSFFLSSSSAREAFWCCAFRYSSSNLSNKFLWSEP